MPFSYGHRRATIRAITGGTPSIAQNSLTNNQYTQSQSSVWRHQYIDATPNQGTPNTISANSYFADALLRNVMTFTASADVPPTPSESNNYPDERVFNGSRIEEFSCVIRLKNNDPVTRYLDLYEAQLSFLDITDWVSVMGSPAVPFNQVLSGVTAGQAGLNAPASGGVNSVTQSAYKTHQRYLRKVGTIELGANDSGDNTVTLHYNRVPSKCRRSNYGMIWALFFVNDFLKNGTVSMNVSFTKEVSFIEIPASSRIPFIQ